MGVEVRAFTRCRTPENGNIPSRAIAKISRELDAAATTISANIENTTIARNTPVAVGPSQYSAMAASGTGDAEIVARSGIASVKPISAAQPSTPDTTTDRIIARGTVRRASTASSAMSAAASNPTSVKIPTSAPPTSASGKTAPGVVVVRKAKPWSDPPRTQAKNTTTESTTVPMISANTATLLTRAASCTRTMLIR